jgi:hypothetical protein
LGRYEPPTLSKKSAFQQRRKVATPVPKFASESKTNSSANSAKELIQLVAHFLLTHRHGLLLVPRIPLSLRSPALAAKEEQPVSRLIARTTRVRGPRRFARFWSFSVSVGVRRRDRKSHFVSTRLDSL